MDKIGGNKMRRALVITVGVGVGEDREKATDSLAHGIYYSIKTSNPDKICFVVTEESRNITFPEVMKYAKNLPEHEFIILDKEEKDDVEKVYKKVKEKIEEFVKGNFEIVVDFTSGTKAMSAGAVLAGIETLGNLKYITGEREKGIVVKGTERAIEMSPVFHIFGRQEKLVKNLFNLYQFDACVRVLESLKKLTVKSELVNKIEDYEILAKAYSAWDKFDHEGALNILRGLKRDFIDVSNNKKFLNLLIKAERREEYLIPDLINNVERRMEEGKYDDAVARLYRCIEMIAQYRLKEKYEIDSSDVDTWRLKADLGLEEKIVEKYEKKRDNDKIKLALNEDLELLKDLGDELGKLKDDKLLQDLLSKRNYSILAHGIQPIGKETATKFYDMVVKIAQKVIDDLEEKMELAKFPKL